jgi:uncharacterized protein YkwD
MAGKSYTRRVPQPVFLAVALMCVFALLAASGEKAAAAKCHHANAAPRDATADQLGKSVLCLIGKERRKADVKKVEQVWSLTKVAEKHTDVMIKEDCLDHRCRGEKSLQDRIVNSGYPIPGGRYGFGEVTGCSLTPQAMVDEWMDKRFHRKVLLGEKYRHVGIGAAKGKPDVSGCKDSLRGVYTVIFGWRRR